MKSRPSFFPREDFDAHLFDHANLARENFARQTIGRNGLHQHAARTLFGLEHSGPIAETRQKECAGQTGRPGADNRDAALGIVGVLPHFGQLDCYLLVGHEALGAADGDRFAVDRDAPAFVVARMKTDPRADTSAGLPRPRARR